MEDMIVAVGIGQHVLEPWGHGTDGAVPQVVRVGIQFCDICGFLFFLPCLAGHLSISTVLDPLGDHLEASSDRDEGFDTTIVVLETFQSIQIGGPFCVCETLGKVVDEGLLPFQSGFHSSDVVLGSLLLVFDIIDKAIDDLSWGGRVSRMGGQGRECGAG